MQLTLTVLAGLVTLPGLAFSALPSQVCFTKLGKTSVGNVPSSTQTFNIPLTKYTQVTLTPATTVTPADVTTTVISTQISTVTTVITTTSTSTVPTPAGFTPISQDSDYVPKIKGRDARGLGVRAAKAATTLKCSDGGLVGPQLYPTAVSCLQVNLQYTTKTKTYTATTTQTVTAPPATQTTTSTTSITTTETQTAVIPGPTIYAACSASNIIPTANGGNTIQVVSTNNGNFAIVNGVSTPYDCCVACQTAVGCRGSFTISGRCYNILASTCSAGAFQGESYQTLNDQSEGFTLSNGPCGSIADGGNEVQS